MWRDAGERPLLYPFFKAYSSFMGIRRYEHMPFYFYPSGVNVVSLQDKILNYVDWLVDAHEDARNRNDANKTFYMRSIYFFDNYLRYQNDTMANVMYETQANKSQYAKLNSTMT
jgi:hypothetical protein